MCDKGKQSWVGVVKQSYSHVVVLQNCYPLGILLTMNTDENICMLHQGSTQQQVLKVITDAPRSHILMVPGSRRHDLQQGM